MTTKTPVSLLQEVLVQHSHPPPQYTITQLPGLTPEFKCMLVVGDKTASATAYSKQEAKHKAAKEMLEKLELPVAASVVRNSSLVKNTGNAIGRLNEFASQNGKPYPIYTECESLEPFQFTIKCEFGSLQSFGTGSNKKDTKQKAASAMLSLLKETNVSSIFPCNNNNSNSSGNLLKKESVSTMVDDLAAKMYKELSLNLNEATKQKAQENGNIAVKLCQSNDNIEFNTVEEAKAALDELGVVYTIETFQKEPLILMLKITNTNQIIMESDGTYETVVLNLLKRAFSMYTSNTASKCDMNFI